MNLPIFEKSQSPLTRSNDGRLMIFTDPIHRGKPIEYTVKLLDDTEIDGEEVFRTFNRVMADAYVAGYDLAEADGRKLNAALHEMVRELGGKA